MNAALKGKDQVVKYLLEAGAKMDLQSKVSGGVAVGQRGGEGGFVVRERTAVGVAALFFLALDFC